MTTRKTSHGDMFPDMRRPFGAKTRAGIVFKASPGGGGPTAPSCEFGRGLNAWAECEQCTDFAGRHQLAMATLSDRTAANGG